ncbi:MAG: DNA polymerase IV [Solobacterium sp.]|nr:DNA polymerase IV [Solobacterium sp.]
MNDKIIFHIDINHCYAQIEEMFHPQLREVPMAVGGHEEKRHGIILAKNGLAKKAGVKTGESLREAYRHCPELLIIPPHYDAYLYYTSEVKKIYAQYSDCIESFGLDEAWIDYTHSKQLFGEAEAIGHAIQDQILRELGLTVSVGISWNKIFAKLGSDFKKPSGFTIITKENYKDLVWPLPARDLLYVGPATERKLYARGIRTIGELAQYPVMHLKKAFGVVGEMLSDFANGRDTSSVSKQGIQTPIQSVGNAMTMIHDVDNLEDVRPVYYVLAEAIASRMKEAGVEGDVIHISFRTAKLNWCGKQRKIAQPTNVSEEILKEIMSLLEECYDFEEPLRAVGASVSGLRFTRNHRQLSLLQDEEKHEKALRIDEAMDAIRAQFGFHSVCRACMLLDRPLTDFNPKGDHVIHPVGYFQGRKMIPNGPL